MAFIEVLGLGYTLPGKRPLFSDVEFKVGSGQRAALIGANGVGKSTLLRVIAGEDDEYIGTVRVEGTLLYMRQFVASADTTVRQLLRGLLTLSMRHAGDELTAAELAAEEDQSEGAGQRCWRWTSRPTTWTSRRRRRSNAPSGPTRARSWRSHTTAGSCAGSTGSSSSDGTVRSPSYSTRLKRISPEGTPRSATAWVSGISPPEGTPGLALDVSAESLPGGDCSFWNG